MVILLTTFSASLPLPGHVRVTAAFGVGCSVADSACRTDEVRCVPAVRLA